jgi:hypothetical protein
MANTILAFDELDKTLGFFFEACKNDLNVFFKTTKVEPVHINSRTLNDLAVISAAEKYPSFVFGGYSHGDKACLATKNPWRPYISIDLNGTHFKNSFFYTFSCSSGEGFGKDVIDKGCLCFIGYKAPIFIWDTYIEPFVNCANYGLKLFFQGHSTTSVLDQMTEYYDKEIDEVYEKDYFVSSILKENRDKLIFHGQDITIKTITG